MDQLDLFVQSCDNEEEERLPQKTTLTPRQWALYRLIYENSIVWKRKTTQREIYEKLKDYGYEWNEDEKAHDHCSAIWSDIAENNESLEHDKIIISKNFEYWIGSKEETERFINDLWKALAPRLRRYWKYLNKFEIDGVGKLFDKNGNPLTERAKMFHECFNDYDIAMGEEK